MGNDNRNTPNSNHMTDDGVPAPEGAANPIDTDYTIGQDNYTTRVSGISLDLHAMVFGFSAIVIVFFMAVTLIFQDQAEAVFQGIFDFLTQQLSWAYLLGANIFLVVCVVLIFTPLARVRLGGAEAKPDFTYRGWFAMLFAAGMGIGLMFYAVSEPLGHFDTAMSGVTVEEDGSRSDWAPLGGAEGDEEAARSLSMAATIFHWGLHPWAIYSVVALALALFSFNKGLPLTIRSIFYPIFGEKVWGWRGHIIDVVAVFATLFGLTTSLGIGARQASAGLTDLFGMPEGDTTMVILIIGITAVALVSILAGVDKGVRRLSEV